MDSLQAGNEVVTKDAKKAKTGEVGGNFPSLRAMNNCTYSEID